MLESTQEVIDEMSKMVDDEFLDEVASLIPPEVCELKEICLNVIKVIAIRLIQ